MPRAPFSSQSWNKYMYLMMKIYGSGRKNVVVKENEVSVQPRYETTVKPNVLRAIRIWRNHSILMLQLWLQKQKGILPMEESSTGELNVHM